MFGKKGIIYKRFIKMAVAHAVQYTQRNCEFRFRPRLSVKVLLSPGPVTTPREVVRSFQSKERSTTSKVHQIQTAGHGTYSGQTKVFVKIRGSEELKDIVAKEEYITQYNLPLSTMSNIMFHRFCCMYYTLQRMKVQLFDRHVLHAMSST